MVNAQDPDFMDSLLARIEAEARVQNKPKGGTVIDNA